MLPTVVPVNSQGREAVGLPRGAGMGRRAAVPPGKAANALAGGGSVGSGNGRPEEPPALPGDDSEVDEVMRCRGGRTRPTGRAVIPVPLGAAVRRCSRIPRQKGPVCQH